MKSAVVTSSTLSAPVTVGVCRAAHYQPDDHDLGSHALGTGEDPITTTLTLRMVFVCSPLGFSDSSFRSRPSAFGRLPRLRQSRRRTWRRASDPERDDAKPAEVGRQ